ncbi:LacI family transcriptional regulator [Microbacterium sp. cx-55]|uniref:LacI family DNA-binding transcriptional regulator n=1 Tax=unclassified Microbacterium TaxID=2609290 RepID=UPI001CBF6914|nr:MULTISPECIES: LacI family DNA-binding transcriptional regulator [unclassified Microbacterium]MBZ4486743.1 LacI family transcriptional regulator [Microbacterium sp. cx-55]MCC4907720.1 LacI family transcriptional regulator [Microbacterium sp. cx-59]UGB36300.1 LacI family transcriptional regulator [Microbacterium sp. cx-55]
MTRIRTVDIAREAGVSRATVSYVLNGRRDGQVSEATRNHVREVARRLGYISSPAANALRSGRGDVVLLLVPDWEVAGQLELLLEEIGRLVGQYDLVAVRYEGPHWQGALDRLLGKVEAACVVTFDPLGDADATALRAAGVPEVGAWILDRTDPAHATAIGQADIVAAQVTHLLERGYERVAYLAIEEPRGRPFIAARVAAFRAFCAERGIDGSASTVVGRDVRRIEEVLRTWTAEASGPWGIAAWNDVTGLGVLTAAASLGLRSPEQVGVIGGDDTTVAAFSDPPLSSVRFNLQAEGRGIAARIGMSLGLEIAPASTDSAVVDVIPRGSTSLPL